MILTVCLSATISAATAFTGNKVLRIAVDYLSLTLAVVIAVVAHKHTSTGIRIDVVIVFKAVLNGSAIVSSSNTADNLTGVHYMAFHHIAVLNETFNQLAGQSAMTTAIAIFPIITDNTQIAHGSGYGSEHTTGTIVAVYRCGKTGNGITLSVIYTGKSTVGNGLSGMVQLIRCCHSDGHIAFNTTHVDMLGLAHVHFAEEAAVHTFSQGHKVFCAGYQIPAFGILLKIQFHITDNVQILFLGNEVNVADIHFHFGSSTQVYTQELSGLAPIETLALILNVDILHCPVFSCRKVEVHFTTAGNGREEEFCINICRCLVLESHNSLVFLQFFL